MVVVVVVELVVGVDVLVIDEGMVEVDGNVEFVKNVDSFFVLWLLTSFLTSVCGRIEESIIVPGNLFDGVILLWFVDIWLNITLGEAIKTLWDACGFKLSSPNKFGPNEEGNGAIGSFREGCLNLWSVSEELALSPDGKWMRLGCIFGPGCWRKIWFGNIGNCDNSGDPEAWGETFECVENAELASRVGKVLLELTLLVDCSLNGEESFGIIENWEEEEEEEEEEKGGREGG